MSKVLLRIDVPDDCKWITAEISSRGNDWQRIHSLRYNEDEVKKLINEYNKLQEKGILG